MCFWYCDCFRDLWAVIVSCFSSHLSLKKVEHGDNYLFHTNQIISRPKGDFIDNIHNFWFGDMERLERNHGYIQCQPHNFLRITRILKCLTIFKLDGYCSMWLKFLLYEVYVTEELNACRNSFERFWLSACSERVQLEVQNSFTREE
ncbi:hypothetical protein HELRODRAFT_180528 [Helobdella robusta]|uniref:Opioid growth factor receptor (OGFr) conserved domain-containing protein n=1 Tax=Helobdella robusta TaxID=6412 RepID=T1FG08_HELRO|nr:hypothetical protein HELRODRAFT_180528 [Helobdella robusta]ESN93875.1 hypothetical protein HELRODRAFT_180528 [Helobdella robusta]